MILIVDLYYLFHLFYFYIFNFLLIKNMNVLSWHTVWYIQSFLITLRTWIYLKREDMKCTILLLNILHHCNICNMVFQKVILLYVKLFFFLNLVSASFCWFKNGIFISKMEWWKYHALWNQTGHRFEPQVTPLQGSYGGRNLITLSDPC